VRSVAQRLSPHRFDRIYGAFAGQCVPTDASAVVQRSAARYIDATG